MELKKLVSEIVNFDFSEQRKIKNTQYNLMLIRETLSKIIYTDNIKIIASDNLKDLYFVFGISNGERFINYRDKKIILTETLNNKDFRFLKKTGFADFDFKTLNFILEV